MDFNYFTSCSNSVRISRKLFKSISIFIPLEAVLGGDAIFLRLVLASVFLSVLHHSLDLVLAETSCKHTPRLTV